MKIKDELVTAIADKMKADNIFDRGLIEEAVEGIYPSKYLEFYKELFGDGFEFNKGLDRVIIVSKRFKAKDEQILLGDTKSEAEAISDSLLAKSNACLDYRYKHKDKYANDEIFFNDMKFDNMRNFIENEPYFTKQEVFVINNLGRDWFRTMSNEENFGKIVNKVERVIKNAKLEKANPTMIDRKVSKQIKGVINV